MTRRPNIPCIGMVAEMTGMVVAVSGHYGSDRGGDRYSNPVAEMVAIKGATATTVTDLVPTDGLDLEKYVPSRYESLSAIIRFVIVAGEL